jgi:DNA-directed RNA polymerase subunit RPC12/RpoP
MQEQNLLCHRCGHIFRLMRSDHASTGQTICPSCGGGDFRILPSWEPLGSNLAEASDAWEYECQNCSRKFKQPVPGSPLEEKNITCPYCEGRHIHRLTALGYEPLYCG